MRTLSDLYHTLSKRFRGFPFLSRDVIYQILSSLEYVYLIKPEVFRDIPFPSPELSQNPFESVSVPISRHEFSPQSTELTRGPPKLVQHFRL